MLGQVPSCVMTWPTTTAADEAKARFMAMPDYQRQATLAPHVQQLQAAGTLPDAVQPEAERRALAALAEQVVRERAVLKMCKDVVHDAVDSILATAPAWSAASYGRERLLSMRDLAQARGVPADSVPALLRQDVYSRVPGVADPWPQGDVEDLASRMAQVATRSAPAPAAPLPPAAPTVQEPAAAPGRQGRREPRRQERPRGGRGGVPMSTVVLGGLALLGIGLALRR